MFQEFGQKVRTVRTKKGIGLNQLAYKIGVSPGHLSNLETGKTENIKLSLLHKLQDELNLFSSDAFTDKNTDKEFDEFDYRLERLNQQLRELRDIQPDIADYFVSTVEHGIDVFKHQESHSIFQDVRDYH
ncbi:helix-turn-helix transcriptional regulator [Schinkia azotoformans]|uniref:helix-turn-helix domain-containing protein n=1 Tax=Schinkia azotoformans TaxID=1454 RepID=UPI002E1BF1A5|nr:helix-turn-helix transcriptional regulator [Schinkia azotoformans]